MTPFVRRFRRPFKVRWNEAGPARLDLSKTNKGGAAFGSFAERVTRIFLSMPPEDVEQVLQTYRQRYGEGAYAYAKRTLASWKEGQVRHVGQTVLRLLDIIPMYVEGETKFELARIMREETLRRLRQNRIEMTVAADEDLSEVFTRLKEVIEAQVQIELPPGLLESQAWISTGDAAVYQRMIRDGEKRLLVEQAADFLVRVKFLQKLRDQIRIPLRIEAVFELPTARIALRIVQARNLSMSQDALPPDDESFLAKWNDLELETRFKSGEVSYPEYVLRNMDQFFTKEEQSELHKIAAMHGLELERLLMEIQIKSRTSEADLQKLLTTLRTLQDKGISADVVSRHETPSGHIEISARSRKLPLGCLPFAFGVAGLLGTLTAFLAHR